MTLKDILIRDEITSIAKEDSGEGILEIYTEVDDVFSISITDTTYTVLHKKCETVHVKGTDDAIILDEIINALRKNTRLHMTFNPHSHGVGRMISIPFDESKEAVTGLGVNIGGGYFIQSFNPHVTKFHNKYNYKTLR